MATCYSYVRFSSEGQRHGTSLERQTELAQRYAISHGHTLDTSTYKDLGVSAFRSKNIDGALGAFIEAVEVGRIPKGSILLVEALDRLSRDTVNVAMALLLRLINNGITVVTLLKGERVLSAKTTSEQPYLLMEALMAMMLANEESANKSKRGAAYYEARRRKGLIAHNKQPAWLTREDEKFIKIPEKVKLVNRIFDMVIAGQGMRSIAQQLNAEKVPTMQWALRWSQPRVAGLIRNEAVYGRLKDDEKHYPPIMTKQKFALARDIVAKRRWKTTRSAGIPNLFAGLIYCADCGERVRYLPSSQGGHLKCRKAEDTKECKARRIRIADAEDAFIYTMTRKANLDISGQFLVEQATAGPSITADIELLKAKQRNLLKLASLAEGVEVVAEELKALQKQINALEGQFAELNRAPITRKEISEHKDLYTRYYFAKEKGEDVTELRRQMRVALSRMFKRIELGTNKLYLTLIDGTRALVKL